MSIARWSVRNRVAVNIGTIALLVAGLFGAATRLPRDIFPDVATNYIRITTIDPTTSLPEDIEQLISIPLEEKVSAVEGLQTLTSFSQDNNSTLFLEIDTSIDDLEPVLNDVRQQVSIARAELPPSAEEPVIETFDIPLPLLTLGVMLPAGFDLVSQREIFDRLERELKLVPGVSDVLVAGLSDREVWVEVDPFRAELAQLGFGEIAATVGNFSKDLTGGRISNPAGQQIVRVQGEIRAPSDLEEFPLPASTGFLRLRDLATVKETQEEANWRGRVNLRPGLTFTIVKRRGADALRAATEAREIFHRIMTDAPAGVEAFVVSDSTKYIDVRIQTVLQNGLQALVIVTVLLVMLLNWRLAVLIAIGLPISFAGTFLVLYWIGETLNLLSLFAMIMAIGMVVDDALVISENVYRYYEAGLSRIEAAVRGTQEVIWPVLGSVSTTVAAFLPLILGEGVIGRFLAVVPLVVISALVFSLVQAFVVLPSHLADFVRPPVSVADLEKSLRENPSRLKRLRLRCALLYAELRALTDRILQGAIQVYIHFLAICLRRRYWVCLGFVLMLVSGGAAVALGLLRFQLFDTDFADRILVKTDLPANFSLDQNEEVIARLEREIVEKLPPTDLVGIVTQIGSRLDESNQFIQYGTNLAMIAVDVDEQHPEARRASTIERQLQQILNGYPEFITATAASEGGGPPVGLPINVRIQGESFAVLRQIASEIQNRLAEVPGVVNLANDYTAGKPEYVYRIDPERAAQYGLTTEDVGRFLQGAYRGLEATRIRWGNDEVVIRVLMEERFRHDPEVLAGLRIPTPGGETIPLLSVTEQTRSSGIARIIRRDQQRMITVSGDIDTRILKSRETDRILQPWISEFEQRYPGYSLTLGGESEDTERSLDAMGFSALIALLLIYVILAVIFNSFLQPVMVMSVIPFGVIGVIGGLLFMGEPLGLMAIMGTIALSGIVVNNSVVFVDFINRSRKETAQTLSETGAFTVSRYARWHSIIRSGRVRFRPIFLTTVTTIAGLFTLAFTTTGQEEFLSPMAQAIVFGLLFATLITMILIPCLYSVIDDLQSFRRNIRTVKQC